MTLDAPLWTSDAMAAATGGVASASFAVEGVSFDSREVLAGDLFVAMKGETSDGHRFVAEAMARGARAALVSEPVPFPHVLVPDTFVALQALGRAARARTSATVVGVTGSVGKTGTKEALARAFRRMAPHATHASVKSYNNHTGVPLSLARMPEATRYAVLEMGMNHAGEIRALTAQVRPHIALITWVASVHIENFADEQGIADAKAEIFEGLEAGGTAIIPADNRHAARLRAAAGRWAERILSFGQAADADVRLLQAEALGQGSRIRAQLGAQTIDLTVGMPGAHWVSNALAVLAVVHAAGGDAGEAALALAGFTDLAGRGARVTLHLPGGTALLIDESYNANPASMAAALSVLGATPAARRIAVLGAMKELGRHSAQLHRDLAGPIAAARVDLLALVGEEMDALEIPGAARFPSASEALAWVQDALRPGDVLMVKGSNSVGLSGLVRTLSEALAGEVPA
ncbi:UDP-N-acetylmuramoyl-tripeptide--D-alanyl-D-alanine ligase [Thermaurantiacus sp.]